MKENYKLDWTFVRARLCYAPGSGRQRTPAQAANYLRHAPDRPKRWLLRAVEGAGVAAVLLTLAGLVLNALPKLSVGSSGSLAPNDPRAAIFYLSNDGMLPIYQVNLACGLNNLGELTDNIVLELGQQSTPVLSPGHRLPLSCSGAVQIDRMSPKAKARITLLVTYRPAGVLWRKHANFPMEAENSASGEWIWKSLAE
jgi:hypothetical protein